MAVDAATVRAAVETAGDAAGNHPPLRARRLGRPRSAPPRRSMCSTGRRPRAPGPSAAGASTYGPSDAMLPWSGAPLPPSPIWATTARAYYSSRARRLKRHQRRRGSSAARVDRITSIRVALARRAASAARPRCSPSTTRRSTRRRRARRRPARRARLYKQRRGRAHPVLTQAPDAGLVAAWVSSSVEEDGAGAWRAAAVEARAVWHRAPTIVVRTDG